MGKTKDLLTNWRIVLLIIFVVLSLIVIHPDPSRKGVTIRSVEPNSTASLAGIENPRPESMPMSRERILFINNMPIDDVEDYYDVTTSFPTGTSIVIKTNRRTYSHALTESGMGLNVYDAPKSNIIQGLDLVGGTRIILKPAEGQNYTREEMNLVVSNIQERLNVYGLKDIVVRKTTSLTGTEYIIVDLAGVSKDEIEGLIERQGKFEAFIGETLVFEGGKNDIPFVCDSAECSGVSITSPCEQVAEQEWMCFYEFQITISNEAADKFFAATSQLEDIGGHLSQNITFVVDDERVSSLHIDSSFKDSKKETASIRGSSSGNSKLDAFNNAIKEMNRMQSILITGNLPVKLEKEQMVSISPTLGEKFLKNATLIGIAALIGVSGMILLRYRKIKYSLPVIITVLSELVMIFGVATLIKWNIDLAAIAGILIAIGTGVDNFIVILDEQNLKLEEETNRKKKFKNAFFIIMGSYFTLAVTMIFLFFAGAGLLKGFALTTLIGASCGVLIARPAFASAIEILTKNDKE